jgi:hypothetical protein
MKQSSLTLLITVLILCIQSCASPPIELTPEKTAQHQYLGEGVWIKIPSGFKKARSYDGYQSGLASISLQVESVPLWKARQAFDERVLKARKTKLLEMHPVVFGEIDSAFFTVVHDTRKRTQRYLLSINDGEKTYNIKAFCLQKRAEHYDHLFRDALFSAYLGEKVDEESGPLFKLASIEVGNQLILTRDEKHPTLSEDRATIMIEAVQEKRLLSSYEERYELIDQEIRKITGKKGRRSSSRILGNGEYTKAYGRTDELEIMIALITLEEGGATLIKASANTTAALGEMEQFIKDQFIEMKFGIR